MLQRHVTKVHLGQNNLPNDIQIISFTAVSLDTIQQMDSTST